jgi:hypothetical protein
MTRSFTYLFSAHAIQRFIFRSSGRLRDAIGASDLLARQTTSSPLSPSVAACWMTPSPAAAAPLFA